MAEQRNIVVLGGSSGGLSSVHYIVRHILPSLKAKKDAKYHVYLLNPSAEYYFRIAAPRVAASTDRLSLEKALYSLPDSLKQYSSNDVTFIQATATGFDPSARTITYKRSEYLGDEHLSYHALIVATGSRTHDSVFSLQSDTPTLTNVIKTRNTKVKSAKNIIIVGGGPTAVEHAGEIAELLNGKPGWFRNSKRNANITLITAANALLPTLRPAIGKQAEVKLRHLGVEVLYGTRVADASTTGDRTIVTLAKGEKMEADLYIPANGVLPNSSFIPSSLLNDKGYLKTNNKTLRVEEAGPRVYAIGDVSTHSRNNVLDIYDAMPALMINLKRDLFAYDPKNPNKKLTGKDREFVPNMKEMQIVPVGSAGGVGAVMGWRVPNFFVWLIKSRDMMVSIGPGPLMTGDKYKKEYVWTAEEAVA